MGSLRGEKVLSHRLGVDGRKVTHRQVSQGDLTGDSTAEEGR